MKTAISIPDKIFKIADILAHEMGISRSELYSKAIEEFIKEHDDSMITEKLDQIYDNQNSTLDAELNSLQIHSLNMDNSEW